VSSWNAYVGAIRQDTAQKRVYFISSFQNIDTLLYDFNLSVGDTLAPSYIYDTAWFKNYVSYIDSVIVGNSYKRQYWISNNFSQNYVALIEGIGSTFGLLNQLAPPFEFGCNLYCFKENGNTVFPDTNYQCLPVSIGENGLLIKNELSAFPNPANAFINFESQAHLKQVTIFNIEGRKLFSKLLSGNTETIDTKDLSEGVYFATLLFSDNTTATKKIVIIRN
jgi:hypothetical protein